MLFSRRAWPLLLAACLVCRAAGYSCGAPRLASRRRARAGAPVLAESGPDGDGGFFRNPFGQVRVPEEQQPARELVALKQAPFYDWAEGEGAEADSAYKFKLGLLYAACFAVVSLPVSSVTYSWNDPTQLLLTATIGTSGAVLPFVLRLRVGWGYVSRRLRARMTYFEDKDERGDSITGGTAEKDRGTLMRDRLVERSEVAPALRRLDASLVALLASLVVGIVALDGLALALGEQGPMVMKSLSGDEARDYTNRLRFDDEFAAREQQRAQRRSNKEEALQPAYCSSRYYKILAGGNGQGGVGCN